jgi:hypothetical protein
MFVTVRRFAIASALVLPAVVGMTVVSASAAPSPHFKVVAIHTATAGTGPNTNLNGSGKTVVFSPKKLKGLAAVSSTDCSTSDYSFSVSNNTSKAQTLTYEGSSIVKIPKATAEAICVTADGSYTLGLKSSPAATLKLTVTS